MSKGCKLFAALTGMGLAAPLMAQVPLSTSGQSLTVIPASQSVTQTQTVNNPGTSTTNFPGTVTNSTTTLVPISAFTPFNTATGILVGAQMTVGMNYNLSLSAFGPGSGNRTVDAQSTVSASVFFNGGRVSSASTLILASCNGGDCGNASSNNTTVFPAANGAATRIDGTASATGSLTGFTLGNQQAFSVLTEINATNTQIQTTRGNNATFTSGNARTTANITGATCPHRLIRQTPGPPSAAPVRHVVRLQSEPQLPLLLLACSAAGASRRRPQSGDLGGMRPAMTRLPVGKCYTSR